MEFVRLDIHIRDVHLKIKRFKCQFCDKMFGRSGNRLTHMRRVHREQFDEEAAEMFFRREQIERGMNPRHTPAREKPRHRQLHRRVCPYCNLQFARLDIHIQDVHLKLKKYGCHLCDLRFAQSGNRMKHLKRVHKGFDKEVAKLYFRREQEERTRKKEEDETRRKDSFLTRSLSWEKRNHNQPRSGGYSRCRRVCPYCNGSFVRLDVHIRDVHLKIKRYKCEFCDKRFSQGGSRPDPNITTPDSPTGLIDPQNFTKGPGQCPYCKDFKKGLRSHIQIVHLKMWRYACSSCDKRFSVLTNLKSHLSHAHKMSSEQIKQLLGKKHSQHGGCRRPPPPPE
ncbi:hypothetical protein ACHWQZ_G001480 [Mnemiopsis leidyi]